MDLGLRERVFLVTGGSAGLGFATAKELVADGARVVLSGRDQERLAGAVESLGAASAEGVCADNADPGAAERLVAAALSRFGRLDGLLVSVGGPPPGAVLEMADDDWRGAFESVFLGSVRLARTAAARLESGGAIAFVLSTSVREPIPDLALSNGLRPGLAMVAKSLAGELGPKGIRVNALLPGLTATGRMRELGTPSTSAIPLGRVAEPAEFGRVAAFVLSPAASYLTGAMIPVDGGRTRAL
ncbi:3-oxoacyl-[acyl-carrier protein] reductase [Amycolatopsis bartoniae]|uniref:Oxidoreductase n=1 Tax=Amycolatopsis bartoniae TaxID=941986 RepID=A0A8H9IWN9_9PSEU|nr:SDR family oxidoreductase [Amycolatopsis bartoniae]MBB2939589.1 3-oxoacyl-[acyl-carrier protein] reductase [Amycolatopsis bartoniae]TVT07800.1 SDR family oxidoreductase [Amycolatopsis bartoniae]GHF39433.1 oxidoreductase [Amycolatopsis bartoniae]